MKVLIVDDTVLAAERIRLNLSAASGDLTILKITDPTFAHDMIDFGVDVDVALIDLRFVTQSNAAGEFHGLSICQKLRSKMPRAVIVGYSSSFSLESAEMESFKGKFREMGADIVCAFDHLTMTPVTELRYEFRKARERRMKEEIVYARPRVFLGSSSEGLEIARRIQADLSDEYSVEIWNQKVFELGDVTIEALEKAIGAFQFGIFVFTPDDYVKRRDAHFWVPRDNVVFEAGLFIGSLSRRRTLIVMPNGNALETPSDIKGVTVAMFDKGLPNMAAALGPVCLQIRDAIRRALDGDYVNL